MQTQNFRITNFFIYCAHLYSHYIILWKFEPNSVSLNACNFVNSCKYKPYIAKNY